MVAFGQACRSFRGSHAARLVIRANELGKAANFHEGLRRFDDLGLHKVFTDLRSLAVRGAIPQSIVHFHSDFDARQVGR